MSNSRIMLTCRHCGEQIVIGQGNLGEYFTCNKKLHESLNAFYSKHCMGECSGDIDCSDDAKDHFVILEKGDTLDLLEVVRCKDCEFNVANKEKDPLDITDYSGDDIVCSYFLTDGLDPNDYCSRGTRTPKERGGD